MYGDAGISGIEPEWQEQRRRPRTFSVGLIGGQALFPDFNDSRGCAYLAWGTGRIIEEGADYDTGLPIDNGDKFVFRAEHLKGFQSVCSNHSAAAALRPPPLASPPEKRPRDAAKTSRRLQACGNDLYYPKWRDRANSSSLRLFLERPNSVPKIKPQAAVGGWGHQAARLWRPNR